jgi:microcystin-dependent protein
MSEPFLSQISMVGFYFAPRGYAQCDGQLVPVSDNQALYSLIGTIYGGNGVTTLGIPDLRGRVPMHRGNGYSQGEQYGVEAVALSLTQMAEHSHFLQASSDMQGITISGSGKSFAPSASSTYAAPLNLTPLNDKANTGVSGGNSASQTDYHTNMQPSSVLNFVIAMTGAYPSRN